MPGRSPTWARSIVREALVLSIAATGRTLRQLTADDLDDLGEEIAACPLITDTARTDGQRVATYASR